MALTEIGPDRGDVKWLSTSTFELDVMGSAAGSARCGTCKASFEMTGTGVSSADGMKFHSQCFRCSRRTCDKPIKGRYALSSASKPECERCVRGDFGEFTTERHEVKVKLGSDSLGDCGMCGKSVSGKFARPVDGPLSEGEYSGKYFHRECFACAECSRQIGSEPYAWNGEMILCQTCVQKYM